ncbi:MAG: SurA N-terminal domain-containing protein [Burkholderiaceae bacterium]|jgi:peptidyl-prolyl cis-trans isomerase D|nr:SurA N-terminal domain-containing protein [Burkholderiaceae bacterium]
MFDFIRHHTKIIMAVLVLLIFPSFVLFGIEGYARFNEGAGTVASVDGRKITQAEWDEAHRQDVERMRNANPNVDLRLLDSPAIKYASLERLVRERVLATAAADERLMVSDQRLADALAQDPSIAALRRADGSLDMDQYGRLLASQGLTPESFEAGVRADMTANQVLGGVAASTLVSAVQADVAMNAMLERREVRVQRFAPTDHATKLNPSDADLDAFYKANLARYQAPESARIEYVRLDLDSVKKGITVSEEELRTYYDQNAASLGAPEQRRISHILINAPKNAPTAEREKAKTAATELLAQLRQAPDTFAEVARKSSQDDASAASGGDLGAFQQGDKGMEPAILKAAYALAKAGDISDLVESDFGYHIVRLTDLKPAAVPPFDKVRTTLEDQYRTQQAQKQFGELAETFKNTAYEQPDSLKPVAEQLKLAIQIADNVQRTPAPGASGVLADARFLETLFSADSLEKKRNTDAVEIGANQLVSGRIVQYAAAHARPLDEVRDQVRADFIGERGAALAREEGQAKLKTWTAQPNAATSLPTAIIVSRDAPQSQPPQLIEAVLRADPAKLPAFVGVDLGAQGYAVARVDKVLPKTDQIADTATQNRQRYEQAWTIAEAVQFYELLKARYKAAILAPDPITTAAAATTPTDAASR